MKMPPCKPNCPKRHPACHDTCPDFIEWSEYKNETRRKQKLDAGNYRSTATQKKTKKDRKRYGAKYMKNKF